MGGDAWRNALIAALVFWLVVVTVVVAVSGDAAGLRVPRCATEDSRNCLWLAPSSGDHRGRSFLDVDGRVYHLDEDAR